MKRLLMLLLAVGFVAAYSVGRAEEEKGSKAKVVTLKGTLVDTKCYFEDGSTNNDHEGMKACGTDCLKEGTPAALLAGGETYILIFPSPAFANYAGKTVEITGRIYGKTNLVPDKAYVMEKGKKKAIKLKSMM